MGRAKGTPAEARPIVSGFCRDARLIAEDKLSSRHGADHHHGLCKGHRCACDCHAESNLPRCRTCNGVATLTESGVCADTDDCHLRANLAAEANPSHQARLARQEAARAARAERRAELEQAREADPGYVPPPRRQRSEPRPTSGRCHHCGLPTKGGRFVAGHDAKLKGDLKRAAELGDVDAVVEAMIRNWPTKWKMPNGTLEAADARMGELADYDAFLAARNNERWRAYEGLVA